MPKRVPSNLAALELRIRVVTKQVARCDAGLELAFRRLRWWRRQLKHLEARRLKVLQDTLSAQADPQRTRLIRFTDDQ